MIDLENPAVTISFDVTIDEKYLGQFISCEGLGCEVVFEQREEGGNNNHVWQLPTRLKHSNIKLSRPLSKDTEKIADWFASMAQGVTHRTARIAAKTMKDEEVAAWTLLDVVPVRWTGPSFGLDSPKAAFETLEIAHHGFLRPEPGPRPRVNTGQN
jgi:phage tail-like protein